MDRREKDVGGGMTNGNEKPRIRIRIGEPTYNASISDDTRGDAKELKSSVATMNKCEPR